ncbi:hypothetical protein [Massilia phyllosphaerae]|uniref:hypothetical protein n=1 Tax=Massilia phyllosphaerae TaxID=3106034 RepID=UPI002B1CAC69|nr:hypothetical protein [Massilia sp. SGZ-792]
MPKNHNYSSIIPLISSPRLGSYRLIFSPANDAEVYGIYVWAQHAAGSLYPLTQNAEITLRNAIDNVATQRFGQYWWKLSSFNGIGTQLFQDGITSAARKLDKSWEDKERKRLGLRRIMPIPTVRPVWKHEEIIAATDFSVWQFVLHDAFASKTQTTHQQYLWPLSMPDVFRQFSNVDKKPNEARRQLINIVKEIRDYRNRLFHHEPIWIKDPGVTNARTAIDTVRKKINRIELLISTIDPRKAVALDKVGVFSFARKVCSEHELNIYRYQSKEPSMTQKKKRVLRSLCSSASRYNSMVTWSYGSEFYGLYRIR